VSTANLPKSLSEWTAHPIPGHRFGRFSKKVCRLGKLHLALEAKLEAQTREKEAGMKEKESAVRNMQVLLSTGELSPTSKQKLVKSIANLLMPAVL
jgi:hypothetical protein